MTIKLFIADALYNWEFIRAADSNKNCIIRLWDREYPFWGMYPFWAWYRWPLVRNPIKERTAWWGIN